MPSESHFLCLDGKRYFVTSIGVYDLYALSLFCLGSWLSSYLYYSKLVEKNIKPMYMFWDLMGKKNIPIPEI